MQGALLVWSEFAESTLQLMFDLTAAYYSGGLSVHNYGILENLMGFDKFCKKICQGFQANKAGI
jgi:hypothetical protein